MAYSLAIALLLAGLVCPIADAAETKPAASAEIKPINPVRKPVPRDHQWRDIKPLPNPPEPPPISPAEAPR